MKRLTQRIPAGDADANAQIADTLALPFEKRQKTRQRARLVSGADVALQLPRGTVTRGGDHLVSETGELIEVVAAPEPVSTVRSDDSRLLARAAYHLGNRHIWVEIGHGWLRYLHDHVVDDMVRGLGLRPEKECAPFEPEGGAYEGHDAHHH